MSKEDLYKELIRLSKQANQRILRAEKLSGITELFEIKDLADKLDSLNMWTKRGRVGTSKALTETQMTAQIKALNEYLKINETKQKGIKERLKQYSERIGKDLSFKEANAVFQVRTKYKEYYEEHSEFWDLARETLEMSYDLETFTEKLSSLLGNEYVDENFKNDLQDLYVYAKGVKPRK